MKEKKKKNTRFLKQWKWGEVWRLVRFPAKQRTYGMVPRVLLFSTRNTLYLSLERSEFYHSHIAKLSDL